MSYKIKSNRLDDVPYQKSPNQGSSMDPRFLVIHFTASRNFQGTADWLKNPRAKASAHLLIDDNGDVIQLVPFNKKAWHAGKSKWKGFRGLNSYSIGIEVMNPGRLKIIGDGVYKTWYGKTLTKDDHPDIIEAPHPNDGVVSGWIPFTEAQNEALIEIGSLLMDHYNLTEVLGHDMIAPHRKNDPGPCMSDSIYEILNGRENDEDEFYKIVNTQGTGLNLRTSPMGKIITNLEEGSIVEKEKIHRGWFFVTVKDQPHLEGWVHSNWLEAVANSVS